MTPRDEELERFRAQTAEVDAGAKDRVWRRLAVSTAPEARRSWFGPALILTGCAAAIVALVSAVARPAAFETRGAQFVARGHAEVRAAAPGQLMVTRGTLAVSAWGDRVTVQAGAHTIVASSAVFGLKVAAESITVEVRRGVVLVDGAEVTRRWPAGARALEFDELEVAAGATANSGAADPASTTMPAERSSVGGNDLAPAVRSGELGAAIGGAASGASNGAAAAQLAGAATAAVGGAASRSGASNGATAAQLSGAANAVVGGVVVPSGGLNDETAAQLAVAANEAVGGAARRSGGSHGATAAQPAVAATAAVGGAASPSGASNGATAAQLSGAANAVVGGVVVPPGGLNDETAAQLAVAANEAVGGAARRSGGPHGATAAQPAVAASKAVGGAARPSGGLNDETAAQLAVAASKAVGGAARPSRGSNGSTQLAGVASATVGGTSGAPNGATAQRLIETGAAKATAGAVGASNGATAAQPAETSNATGDRAVSRAGAWNGAPPRHGAISKTGIDLRETARVGPDAASATVGGVVTQASGEAAPRNAKMGVGSVAGTRTPSGADGRAANGAAATETAGISNAPSPDATRGATQSGVASGATHLTAPQPAAGVLNGGLSRDATVTPPIASRDATGNVVTGSSPPVARAESFGSCEGGTARSASKSEPAALTNALREEAALLQRGEYELRTLRDAAASLGTLQRAASKFPRGSLQQEVALTELEALRDLERWPELITAVEAFARRYPHSERLDEVRALGAFAAKQR